MKKVEIKSSNLVEWNDFWGKIFKNSQSFRFRESWEQILWSMSVISGLLVVWQTNIYFKCLWILVILILCVLRCFNCILSVK